MGYSSMNSIPRAQAVRTLSLPRIPDSALSLAVTALCSVLVYWCLGKPGIIGIDDENITQVYGRNLAQGYGYVYTPHFEHVEGATSPLWVAIHFLLYKLSVNPEIYLLLCAAVLTWMALYWSLGIATRVIDALSLPRWALLIPLLSIALQPSYFAWMVWSVMDQCLWSAVVLGLSSVLIRQLSAEQSRLRATPAGLLLCALAVLARPESMLLVPAILALAALVVAADRGVKAAMRYSAPYYAATLLTLVALTAWRIAYFGYPFPNTYYAKVSSHAGDNLVSGIHYVVKFLGSNMLITPAVLAATLGCMIGARALLASMRSRTRMNRADLVMFIVGGTIIAAIATQLIEGGDHFYGFRLFQPYMPLLAVALLFYLPLVADWGRLTASAWIRRTWLAGLIAAASVASYAAFYVDNTNNGYNGMAKEFVLAQQGRHLGDLLNQLPHSATPDVGVLPAGGIALAYRGRVVDLLGLNWAEMAHATGRRAGPRGHSAFDLDVFWRHPPAIMLPTLVDQANPFEEGSTPSPDDVSILKGLLDEAKFRSEYRPILFSLGGGQLFAYARAEVIEHYQNDPRLLMLDWKSLRPPAN
jgi:arabinofuranosyltransferase